MLDEPFKPADGPFQYVVLSRTTYDTGTPRFDRHTLAESAQTFEQALAYGARRQKAGYWVDIYKELAYALPADTSNI